MLRLTLGHRVRPEISGPGQASDTGRIMVPAARAGNAVDAGQRGHRRDVSDQWQKGFLLDSHERSIIMTTALIYHDRFGDHHTGAGHPERPDRLKTIVRGLQEQHLWNRCQHLTFEPATLSGLLHVHDRAYIDRLRQACQSAAPFIDTVDSAICPVSYDVAILAAGGLLAAAEAVVQRRCRNAFCAVRPPGHHAERDRSMGFCLLNNAAIVTDDLIRRHGLDRVAIVDFDVHHGNGTQHIFEDRADVLYISLHEHPDHLYPGTGFDTERGIGLGEGFTVNLPITPGSSDVHYRQIFDSQVIPALDRFAPDALVISAGFDAANEDPLAHMQVTTDGFLWMTQQLTAVANRHCDGRLISTLEGGYHLESLARNVTCHVESLLKAGGSD